MQYIKIRTYSDINCRRVGTVVGCGISYSNREVFFTVDGIKELSISADEESFDLTRNIYPMISIYSEQQVEAAKANFGDKPFKYVL